MTYILVGLGNPGETYKDSRHNMGRIVLDYIKETHDLSEWKYDKKSDALVSKGKIGKTGVVLVKPETYMNHSGESMRAFLTDPREAEHVLAVYDDIDLPFGALKISYNRGSGGHKGVESLIRSMKTRAFTRLRVGIAPRTPGGKVKKPKGDEEVHAFLLGKFRVAEKKKLKEVACKAAEAVCTLIQEGREKAMSLYN